MGGVCPNVSHPPDRRYAELCTCYAHPRLRYRPRRSLLLATPGRMSPWGKGGRPTKVRPNARRPFRKYRRSGTPRHPQSPTGAVFSWVVRIADYGGAVEEARREFYTMDEVEHIFVAPRGQRAVGCSALRNNRSTTGHGAIYKRVASFAVPFVKIGGVF